MDKMRESFESSSIFTQYYSDEHEFSGDMYQNSFLQSDYIKFCEGYQAALAQANVNEQSQAQQPNYGLHELAQIIMSDCGISTTNNDQLYDRILGRLIASSELQSQAQQPEYTFDQLTKLMMQAATKEGHKVTMKIKWSQPPAPVSDNEQPMNEVNKPEGE